MSVDNKGQGMADAMQVEVIERGQAGSVHIPAARNGAALPETAQAVPGRSHARPWFCIQHRADAGFRVRLDLRREGCEVHWPRTVERPPGRDDVLRPLFPGYLFARPPAGLPLASLRDLPNVHGPVGVGRCPTQCDRLVASLIARAGGAIDGVIDETPDGRAEAILRRFKPDDAVDVTLPLWGRLRGLMRSDKGGARVQVLLEFLGGARLVSVPRDQVSGA